jgi:hypothetical protein
MAIRSYNVFQCQIFDQYNVLSDDICGGYEELHSDVTAEESAEQ